MANARQMYEPRIMHLHPTNHSQVRMETRTDEAGRELDDDYDDHDGDIYVPPVTPWAQREMRARGLDNTCRQRSTFRFIAIMESATVT